MIRLLMASVALALCLVAAPRAHAMMEIDITEGNLRPMPIAIAPFLAGDEENARLADGVTGIIAANLERSGLFKSIPRDAFTERIFNIDVPPRFGEWRAIKAEALVVGQVNATGDGRIKARFRLWDIFTGRELDGEAFYASSDEWRRIGHIISDAVYERLTGERGYFDSNIAFIEESGPKAKRVKRLAIMDQDGANLRYLTDGGALALTPRFSPNNQELVFTSYAGGQPAVMRMNIATGQTAALGKFPGMTFAPRFAPSGEWIVMSLQREGSTNIYAMDLSSGRLGQLTDGQAIDTGPCLSPNGERIVFESDRTGSQQLFVMNKNGGNQRRITGGTGRYSTPVWSPRGDLIAFTKQIGGNFLIGVIKPDGTGERILTEGYHNEAPSWSPNGRVIIFFRETPGERGGPRLHTIDLTGYNERRIETPAFASDPAWSPLRR